jgi:hypothetical protein
VRHVNRLVETRQKHQRLADIVDGHHGLGFGASVRLETALRGVPPKGRLSVTNIELGAGNAVLATVQRGGLCEAEDGVFGDGVRRLVYVSASSIQAKEVRRAREYALGRGEVAEILPLLTIRPPWGDCSFMSLVASFVHCRQLWAAQENVR